MINQSPKISVIVPVYNAEKYLSRCINSILGQNFSDFELLLINDGSKDNSGRICDEYANKDKRIRVFHKENKGVTSARKEGVKMAVGEYLLFSDADDEIPFDTFRLLYEKQHKNNIDILVTAKKIIGQSKTSVLHNKIEGKLSKEEYVIAMLNGDTFIGPHGRMIKRDLFLKTNAFNIPDEIVINEDLIMNLKLGAVSKNIFVTNDIISYNYYCIPNSASKKIMDLNYWLTVFSIIEKIIIYEYHYSIDGNILLSINTMKISRILQSTQEPKEIKKILLNDIEKVKIPKELKKNLYLIKYRQLSLLIKLFYKIKHIINKLFFS